MLTASNIHLENKSQNKNPIKYTVKRKLYTIKRNLIIPYLFHLQIVDTNVIRPSAKTTTRLTISDVTYSTAVTKIMFIHRFVRLGLSSILPIVHVISVNVLIGVVSMG